MRNKYFIAAFLTFQFSFAQFTLTPFNQTDNLHQGFYFGAQMNVSGNRIAALVQPSQMLPGFTGKLYQFDTTTLQQTDALLPAGITPTDGFGSAVSQTMHFTVVGAAYDDHLIEDAGAVYVYNNISGNWSQTITAPDAAVAGHFGTYIETYGTRMFISAVDADNNGAVYFYHYNGSQWEFSQKLTVPGVKDFGNKVRFQSEQLIISSTTSEFKKSFNLFVMNSDNSSWILESSSPGFGSLEDTVSDFCFVNGRIYMLWEGLNWRSQVQMVDYFGQGQWSVEPALEVTEGNDHFFTRIEVIGDKMFLGSSGYALLMARKYPVLYYRNIMGIWTFQSSIYGTGPEEVDDHFGSSMFTDGSNMIIGSANEGTILPYGKAYKFSLTLGTDNFQKDAVSLYPNPSNDLVYIQNQSGNKIVKSEIYSVAGKLLSTTENVEQLSIGNLANGIYFAKLFVANGSNQTYKIIKN